MIGDEVEGPEIQGCVRSIILPNPPKLFLKGLSLTGVPNFCILGVHSFFRQCFKG